MKKKAIIVLGILIAIIIAFHFSESKAKATNPEITGPYINFHQPGENIKQLKKYRDNQTMTIIKNTIRKGFIYLKK